MMSVGGDTGLASSLAGSLPYAMTRRLEICDELGADSPAEHEEICAFCARRWLLPEDDVPGAWRSVIVPVDGSLVAESALPVGVEVARRAGALLHLLHVPAPVPPTSGGAAGAAAALEARRVYVTSLVHALGRDAPPCMTALLPVGDPVAGVVDYVAGAGADLVVLATHGHGALGRAWIGSFARRLLPSLPVPLLVVRPGMGAGAGVADFRNVAVLLDGSERAEAVLDPVSRLGEVFHARYALVRVCQGESRAAAAARDYLEEVAQVLRGRGLEVATLVLRGSDIAATAADFACTAGADLVAVATRGNARIGLGRGSIAQELLRLGGAPLLSLRARGE